MSTMAMEAEYTLPQHSSAMNPIPEEDHRRNPPEPYASSAIYTELNYQVRSNLDNQYHLDLPFAKTDYQEHTDAEDSCFKCAVSPGSYDNSMVRSYDSNQYSNEECSTCCRSSSSTLTKEYSEMTKCGNGEEQDLSIEECPSCKTNQSRSSSNHEGKQEWAMAEVEYDYPQWHWLARENSFRNQAQDMAYSSAGRSDQSNCRMNLCDILPPPPYER